MINNNNSFFKRTANAPSDAPVESDPISPINTSAGEALNHKYPKQAPAIAPERRRRFAEIGEMHDQQELQVDWQVRGGMGRGLFLCH